MIITYILYYYKLLENTDPNKDGPKYHYLDIMHRY